jgi:hypothetical protein
MAPGRRAAAAGGDGGVTRGNGRFAGYPFSCFTPDSFRLADDDETFCIGWEQKCDIQFSPEQKRKASC